jgi:dienelactone hydrolase
MKDTDPVTLVLDALQLLRDGKFADVAGMFDPKLRFLITPELLQAGWTSDEASKGPIQHVGEPVIEAAGTQVVIRLPLTCENGNLTLLAVVTQSHDGTAQTWLAGLQLASEEAAEPVAPWEPPPYADPAAFTEEDVTLGPDSLCVPGTLTLPNNPAGPAVVLLPGSGPNDRDETIGRNKPLKDLAWGLATRGITVLRFDKVTLARPGEVTAIPGYTMNDEYVPQATAALRLLGTHPAVDPARVFVAGHSLGGTVAPRVAAAQPPVAGLAILAGGAQPLHWAIVRQARYLASLSLQTAEAVEPTLAALTRQAEAVDSPGLVPDTPDSQLPFGVPAPYWLDIRGYDPAAAAAALGLPVLLLQGGRDYQATVAEDLAAWQAGLAGSADVAVRVYDADNHLFFAGTGPSTPTEYEPAQHVDPEVVADLAAWLTTGELPS